MGLRAKEMIRIYSGEYSQRLQAENYCTLHRVRLTPDSAPCKRRDLLKYTQEQVALIALDQKEEVALCLPLVAQTGLIMFMVTAFL